MACVPVAPASAAPFPSDLRRAFLNTTLLKREVENNGDDCRNESGLETDSMVLERTRPSRNSEHIEGDKGDLGPATTGIW